MTVDELVTALVKWTNANPAGRDLPLLVNTGEDGIGTGRWAGLLSDDAGTDAKFGWTTIDGRLCIDLTGGAVDPNDAVAIDPSDDGGTLQSEQGSWVAVI